MFNPLSYLRAAARDAVLGGIADAVAIATPDGDTPPPDLQALRSKLATPPAAIGPAAEPAADPADAVPIRKRAAAK